MQALAFYSLFLLLELENLKEKLMFKDDNKHRKEKSDHLSSKTHPLWIINILRFISISAKITKLLKLTTCAGFELQARTLYYWSSRNKDKGKQKQIN